MPFPHKNIRLHPSNYLGQRSYFVTLCCASRRPIFANSKNAAWLIEILRQQSTAHGFAVRAYCVMPDHFHVLVTGLDPASDLLAFVKNLKLTTSLEYRTRFGRTLWQKKFYDYILRRNDNAMRVAAYIWMNPVRKGLCTDPEQYPHSGSFVMDWKKKALPVEIWTPNWKPKAPA
ncbi:MAG: transposase [Candidatus Acidiferrales bacterium]